MEISDMNTVYGTDPQAMRFTTLVFVSSALFSVLNRPLFPCIASYEHNGQFWTSTAIYALAHWHVKNFQRDISNCMFSAAWAYTGNRKASPQYEGVRSHCDV
jgi:hypothetical protein